jgi:DNA transformation protein
MTPEKVLDWIAPLGVITCRSMFGGHRSYWTDTIFGIVFQDRLYLKVDDQSRGDYLARDIGLFLLQTGRREPTEIPWRRRLAGKMTDHRPASQDVAEITAGLGIA